MGRGLEARFDKYCDTIVSALMHEDRGEPARWYIKGLMLPGERKSVEPMAARVQPQSVRSAHQSMHHLVADAPWSDEAVLSAVAAQVLPKLVRDDEPVRWIVDDNTTQMWKLCALDLARGVLREFRKQLHQHAQIVAPMKCRDGEQTLHLRTL